MCTYHIYTHTYIVAFSIYNWENTIYTKCIFSTKYIFSIEKRIQHVFGMCQESFQSMIIREKT